MEIPRPLPRKMIPMDDPDLQPDTDLRIQEILLAASQHDLTKLHDLLQSHTFPDCKSVDVQDPETGFTPLHAAIAACEAEDDGALVNGSHPDLATGGLTDTLGGQGQQKELLVKAQETVRFLLQNGAIWNQLDMRDETPGCIANRLGFQDLYELMVDAGVRAELLLNRLEGYEMLEGSDEDEADRTESSEKNQITQSGNETQDAQSVVEPEVQINSAHYLSSTLSIGADRILDEQSNGVMMSWESGIMSQSADALLTTPGLKVINIGFGMGIIDTQFQSHSNRPSSHHIVEAHPAVLADMKATGWFEKSGVVIHQGRWQDILPKLVIEGQTFDAIYFDTYAESYSDFRDFFSEQVMGLLDSDGKFSFFNGLGADRQISYDVYQKVLEMDLFETGFDVDWRQIEVPKLEEEWEGVTRRYWNIEKYRLPVCRYMD
jgi:type IV protein arginine methyltransferase